MVGEGIVLGRSLALLGSGEEQEGVRSAVPVWSKSGRLAERAGGFVVNGNGQRLPGSTEEGLGSCRGGCKACRGDGRCQGRVHPDQNDRDHQQNPSDQVPGYHRL